MTKKATVIRKEMNAYKLETLGFEARERAVEDMWELIQEVLDYNTELAFDRLVKEKRELQAKKQELTVEINKINASLSKLEREEKLTDEMLQKLFDYNRDMGYIVQDLCDANDLYFSIDGTPFYPENLTSCIKLRNIV